jgi:hypothetical protein
VHSIEFIGGTNVFFCDTFLHYFDPKKEKRKKKKEYIVTEACLIFLPKHLAEARTFFNLCGQKISKYFFRNSKFSRHCTEKQIFPQFCPTKLLGCKKFAHPENPELDDETLHITGRH